MHHNSLTDPPSDTDLAARLHQVGAGPSLTRAILALAEAGAAISRLAARGPLATTLDGGARNADGDVQKPLDVESNRLVLEALSGAGVAYLASEEEEAILTLDPKGTLAVAVDPLDGSSNIESDVSFGTIFAIFPAAPEGATASFFRPGDDILAAGYLVYGPHTALVLTVREGVDLFVLDPETGVFHLARAGLQIPPETREFAINISNYRHWHHPVRLFIDDCMAGQNGPRGADYNMRWIASLVAEAHRILSRGGVFLYPADHRPGYNAGRLRLLYEAMPMALIMEQAGGAATEGHHRILGLTASDLHQRIPLIFGSKLKVEMVSDYHLGGPSRLGDAPLFGRRGLYRK